MGLGHRTKPADPDRVGAIGEIAAREAYQVLRTREGALCPSCGGGPDLDKRSVFVTIPTKAGVARYYRYPCLGCEGRVDCEPGEIREMLRDFEVANSAGGLRRMAAVAEDFAVKAIGPGEASVEDRVRLASTAHGIERDRWKIAGLFPTGGKQVVDNRGSVNILGATMSADGPVAKTLAAMAKDAVVKRMDPDPPAPAQDAEFTVPRPKETVPADDPLGSFVM